MEPKDRSSLESKDLLQNRVSTPVQAFTTKIKYPCTGFCYMVAQNRSTLIDLYTNRETNPTKYYNYIRNIILLASERKKNNSKIHERGEYIKCETTEKDFPEIYNVMTFAEVGSPDDESFAIAQNNLYMLLMDTEIGGYMMITRSDETFIMLKLDFENLLVVDSHQPFHGTLNIETATQYILKSGTYKGLSQIGYISSGLGIF